MGKILTKLKSSIILELPFVRGRSNERSEKQAVHGERHICQTQTNMELK